MLTIYAPHSSQGPLFKVICLLFLSDLISLLEDVKNKFEKPWLVSTLYFNSIESHHRPHTQQQHANWNCSHNPWRVLQLQMIFDMLSQSDSQKTYPELSAIVIKTILQDNLIIYSVQYNEIPQGLYNVKISKGIQ